MFTFRFQYNFLQVTASFSAEVINSWWLAIRCYSGVPGLSTGSLKGLAHAILGNFSIDQIVIELTNISK